MGGLGQGLAPGDSCMEMAVPLLGPVLSGWLKVGVGAWGWGEAGKKQTGPGGQVRGPPVGLGDGDLLWGDETLSGWRESVGTGSEPQVGPAPSLGI